VGWGRERAIEREETMRQRDHAPPLCLFSLLLSLSPHANAHTHALFTLSRLKHFGE
jgi:hypothetical protein